MWLKERETERGREREKISSYAHLKHEVNVSGGFSTTRGGPGSCEGARRNKRVWPVRKTLGVIRLACNASDNAVNVTHHI